MKHLYLSILAVCSTASPLQAQTNVVPQEQDDCLESSYAYTQVPPLSSLHIPGTAECLLQRTDSFERLANTRTCEMGSGEYGERTNPAHYKWTLQFDNGPLVRFLLPSASTFCQTTLA